MSLNSKKKGGKIINTEFFRLPHPQFTEKVKLNMIKIFHYTLKILHVQVQHYERLRGAMKCLQAIQI